MYRRGDGARQLGSLFDKVLVIDDAFVYYQRNTNVVGFAHPVSAINMKRNLSTILSRFYSRGGGFQKSGKGSFRICSAARWSQRRTKE